jgi:hypothetical protein
MDGVSWTIIHYPSQAGIAPVTKEIRRKHMQRKHIILIIIVILLAIITVRLGGISEMLSYPCRQDAEAMGLEWMYSPTRGCFVQQPDGSWMLIDPRSDTRNP